MQNNESYVRHVGYGGDEDSAAATYFSTSTAKFIAAKIDELVRATYNPGGGVVVPLDKIMHLMNSVYHSYRPPTGDIYGRYNVPNDENRNRVDAMINQVISIAVDDIVVNLSTEANNARLTAWTALYGTFNEHGLRAHPPIKLRRRRPAPMQFNMNY